MNTNLPPTEFSNHINDICPGFDWARWRESKEWKMFAIGYNAAMREIGSEAKAKIYDPIHATLH